MGPSRPERARPPGERRDEHAGAGVLPHQPNPCRRKRASNRPSRPPARGVVRGVVPSTLMRPQCPIELGAQRRKAPVFGLERCRPASRLRRPVAPDAGGDQLCRVSLVAAPLLRRHAGQPTLRGLSHRRKHGALRAAALGMPSTPAWRKIASTSACRFRAVLLDLTISRPMRQYACAIAVLIERTACPRAASMMSPTRAKRTPSGLAGWSWR